ncbi:hypothetical protein [Frigidibacter sp. MR17.24]|uniref:hypothetical protein n=1 Tax=Frigidibacter sp. MR17.24 TaxID=3127345 RepID=UPI003012B911
MTKAPKSATKGRTADDAAGTTPAKAATPAGPAKTPAAPPETTGAEAVAKPKSAAKPKPSEGHSPAPMPATGSTEAEIVTTPAATVPTTTGPEAKPPLPPAPPAGTPSTPEAAKPDAAKTAATTPATGKTDTVKSDPVKTETPKTDPAKADPAKPDPAKAGATAATGSPTAGGTSTPVPPTTRAAATPPSEAGGSSFWPAILGGVIAAGIGAAVVLWVFPEGLRPGPRGPGPQLEQTLADQRARIATLESEVSALRSAQPMPDGTAALSDEIVSRLDALEAGQGGGGAGLDDLRAQIAALSDRLDNASDLSGAEDRIREAQAQAEELARQAQARAALSHLQAALESGAALDGPRADLTAAGVTVPAALQGTLPSTDELADAFPEAARDGLSASLAATRADGSLGDRALAYLQSATGARSLTPHEGSDPDAVLSRAEAAVQAGDLSGAVAEIGALPPAGQEAMAPWTERARARIAADEAVAGIASGLN